MSIQGNKRQSFHLGKKRVTGTTVVLLLLGAWWPAASPSQEARPARPALIRDTAVAEGKDEADAKVEKTYNPMLAAQNIKVGNFYYKRKNYAAAIERYKEALEYQPNRVEAFDALGRAYEKSHEDSKALELYRAFLAKYPDSPKVAEFRSRIARLEKK